MPSKGEPSRSVLTLSEPHPPHQQKNMFPPRRHKQSTPAHSQINKSIPTSTDKKRLRPQRQNHARAQKPCFHHKNKTKHAPKNTAPAPTTKKRIRAPTARTQALTALTAKKHALAPPLNFDGNQALAWEVLAFSCRSALLRGAWSHCSSQLPSRMGRPPPFRSNSSSRVEGPYTVNRNEALAWSVLA